MHTRERAGAEFGSRPHRKGISSHEKEASKMPIRIEALQKESF